MASTARCRGGTRSARQAKDHLSRTEDAHRQRMLPPLPNEGYPLRSLPHTDGASSKEGSSTPRNKGGRASVRSSVSLPPVGSDRMARSAPAGLDLSQPDETAAETGQSSARGEESEDDLEDELRELEELTAHLARHGAEQRPYTGEIESTTASGRPASSLATASVAEDYADPVSEDPLEHLQGAMRVHQEISQLRLPHGCRLETSQASFAQLFFSMDVAEGPFTPSSLVFWVKIFAEYPLPGSVSIRSTKRIFHPSIDAQTGAVALPGEDGASKVNLGSMLTTLAQMVKMPQSVPEPMNAGASSLLSDDPAEFRRAVRLALSGGEVLNLVYDRILNPKAELS